VKVKLGQFFGLLMDEPPGNVAWLAALTATCGTFDLAWNGNGADTLSLVTGDLLPV